MTLKVVSLLGSCIVTLASGACNSAPRVKELQAATTPVSLRIRCQPQSASLECRAYADETFTERVRWTTDTHAVVVEEGNIRADVGGTATVTASLIDAPSSASVMVVADARSGETRQAYVFE